jgi:hypothetical protein
MTPQRGKFLFYFIRNKRKIIQLYMKKKNFKVHGFSPVPSSLYSSSVFAVPGGRPHQTSPRKLSICGLLIIRDGKEFFALLLITTTAAIDGHCVIK